MMNFDKFFGKRIGVAVSGGADSTALLHYLKERENECGYSLCVVHCEHGIRGEESIADSEFVDGLCREWSIPLFVFEEDCIQKAKTEKCSLETAARNFRYECFSYLVENGDVDYIATAHHENDEAETVLFRIARGTSLSGVKGMEEENGYLLRPFLRWSKAKILAYVKEHGLFYREDRTNFELDATRNKLRLTVFPALESAMAGAAENFARFARLAAEDDALLYEWSKPLLSEKDGVFTVQFSEKKPLFRRACLSALKALGVERDYTALHLESVYALQEKARGARIDLPRGVTAEKTQDGVVLYKKTEEILPALPNGQPFSVGTFDGGRYEVNVSANPTVCEGNEWRVLRVDEEKVPADATFRFRKEGDTFEKFGGGKKTLKKFFNEQKLPVKERGYLPLLASRMGNEVYAVCGVEIADRLKVTENTRSVLYIVLRKK